ncbi:hypothetical protein MATL_G00125400 [Megalops atlanticus]|uniref:Uncharacterized protein n=1 Tax=Megalops atlanticus TaxID=7932 RepID=A0A9D3T3H1_MEGAT|nr:hypothetical protein MATL_G00125400 [Megalops atlanticus]
MWKAGSRSIISDVWTSSTGAGMQRPSGGSEQLGSAVTSALSFAGRWDEAVDMDPGRCGFYANVLVPGP